jgi:hypothetical protein
MNARELARLVAVTAIASALVACDTGGVAQHSPSPQAPHPTASPASTPTPTNTFPLAVYDGPTLKGNGHVINVVGMGNYGLPSCEDLCVLWAAETAKLLFTVEGAARTQPPIGVKATDLPYVSTSTTHVYFLDGDSTIRAIAIDGTVTKASSVPGTAAIHAAFAVSPQDDRIAVALIDYSAQPIKETTYVANLDGGARVGLFTSTTGYYWPVGWHDGKVVLANGPAVSDGSVPPNQYSATGFALVDATAGAQPALIGPGDCVPTGSATPAGIACVSKPGTSCRGDVIGTNGSFTYFSSCLRRLGWDGKETNFGLTSKWRTDLAVDHAALSTDGHVIVGEQLFWVLEPDAGGYPGYQAGYADFTIFNQLPEQPGMGWIDPLHFSMTFVNSLDGSTYQRIYALTADYAQVRNVYFAGSRWDPHIPRSPVVGQFLGTVPGGL